jgi:hypothetical protein
MIYLVLYQTKDAFGHIKIQAHSETFENQWDADNCAEYYANKKGLKAWLYGVQRPPLIELVKEIP